MEILVGLGLHSRCPVALKIFVAFSKNGNVQEKYLSSLLSGHPTVAEYIESSASELSEENVISKDQNWWEPHVRSSQYFTQIVKCDNEECCKQKRNSYFNVIKKPISSTSFADRTNKRGPPSS